MQLELGAGLWVLLALAVGVLAAREFGRSGVRWFLLALFFTPLVGLLLFILPAHRRPCPFCAEPIKPSAVVCRFCGREVPVAEPAGLPRGTRILLMLLVLGVMAAALSECHSRWWGEGASPIQVHGKTARPGAPGAGG